MVVSSLIFRFNRQGQGFDGSQMQVCDLFNVPFLILQLAEIQAVGAINHIDSGDEQQRCFPIKFAVKPSNDARDAGAHQVVGERPEVAVDQNLPERFVFADGNDDGDAASIDDEVCDRCQTQDQRTAHDEVIGQCAVIDQICQCSG